MSMPMRICKSQKIINSAAWRVDDLCIHQDPVPSELIHAALVCRSVWSSCIIHEARSPACYWDLTFSQHQWKLHYASVLHLFCTGTVVTYTLWNACTGKLNWCKLLSFKWCFTAKLNSVIPIWAGIAICDWMQCILIRGLYNVQHLFAANCKHEYKLKAQHDLWIWKQHLKSQTAPALSLPCVC